jgi:hypothetical protein
MKQTKTQEIGIPVQQYNALAKEAKRRGVTIVELLRQEIAKWEFKRGGGK